MKHWKRIVTAGALSAALLAGGVSVLATQGGMDDPLITLSYLTEVFTPAILSRVDEQTAASRQDYVDKLNASVTDYTAQMDKLLQAQEAGDATPSAAFGVVELPQGGTLTAGVGCELLLRAGDAHCVSAESPGLVDSTDGSILNGGNPLQKNHLYVVTAEGRSVVADSAVTMLVRGAYTIS